MWTPQCWRYAASVFKRNILFKALHMKKSCFYLCHWSFFLDLHQGDFFHSVSYRERERFFSRQHLAFNALDDFNIKMPMQDRKCTTSILCAWKNWQYGHTSEDKVSGEGLSEKKQKKTRINVNFQDGYLADSDAPSPSPMSCSELINCTNHDTRKSWH